MLVRVKSETSSELSSSQPSTKRVYFLALDGLRGLAIIGVLLAHSAPQLAETTLRAAILNSITHLGGFGVDLFFVLSGFLITGILLDTKGSPLFFRSFYIRRFLRLFPIYYGFLLLVATVVPLVHHLAHMSTTDYHGSWWWYIFYLSNWKPNYIRDPYLNHFWSLAIEEQFYLTWPLTVYLLTRRSLAWTCMVLCSVAIGLRFYLAGNVYAFTITRLDALSAGALVALALRDLEWSAWLIPRSRAILALSLGGMVACILNQWHHVWNPWSATFATAFFGIVVFRSAANVGHAARTFQRWKLLRTYGKYSYCLYVVHILLLDYSLRAGDRIHQLWRSFPAAATTAGAIVAANILAYLIAKASWKLIESPLLELKRRIAPQRLVISAE